MKLTASINKAIDPAEFGCRGQSGTKYQWINLETIGRSFGKTIASGIKIGINNMQFYLENENKNKFKNRCS